MKNIDSTDTRRRITAPAAAGFLANFLLMSSGFFFNISYTLFFFPINVILLSLITAVSAMRMNRRFHRRLLVRIGYFGFFIFTLDVLVLMQSGIYGWKPPLLAAAPASYLFMLFIRFAGVEKSAVLRAVFKIPVIGWLLALPRTLRLDAWQLLLVPFVITFFISSKSDSPESPEACAGISSQPGMRLLLPTSELHGEKIRDMLLLHNPHTAVLIYRHGIFSDFTKHLAGITQGPPGAPVKGVSAIDAVNLDTGRHSDWLKLGEAIGITRFPKQGGDIYAVVVSKEQKPAEHVSYTDLIRFDTAGNIKARIPFPAGKPDSYVAVMLPLGNKLLIIVEDVFHLFDPATNRIDEVGATGNTPPFTVERRGDFLYGVNVHSPLFVLFTYDSLIKYDLRRDEVVGRKYGGLFGYYDIHTIPGSDKFLLSNQWIGGGIVIDDNLRRTGAAALPPGTRKFIFDKSGNYIFAPNFFSGVLSAVDFRRNRILAATRFVGRGTRSMELAPDGKVLIGNSCGIVEADPAALTNSNK